jgi:CDP-glucose 4,6-dehydratase
MNWDFWRDKRVFVTGHTGFKGSWLALWLRQLGATVSGYALQPPTTPSLFEEAAVVDAVRSTIGDVRDYESLVGEIARFEPDIVFHLAAQSLVLRSYEDPLETYTTNVIGTANLLQALRRLSRRCTVVNVTTDKVYENRQWVWGYRENDSLGGRDPYSSSKACAELVARAFRDSFFTAAGDERPQIGVASARAGNVIGGGDWTPRQLIPDTVLALSQHRPVVLRHPEATRPWQHVLDCLFGYLTLAEALHGNVTRYATEWNFGPSAEQMQPVSRVVEIFATHWGLKHSWQRDQSSLPHEELNLCLDSHKANQELRWTCLLSLDAALEWTASWYRRRAEGFNARLLCDEQIERYTELRKCAASTSFGGGSGLHRDTD